MKVTRSDIVKNVIGKKQSFLDLQLFKMGKNESEFFKQRLIKIGTS